MKCCDCEFYRDDRCFKAEKMLSMVDDPVCLARIQIMLLRDLCNILVEDSREDEENT